MQKKKMVIGTSSFKIETIIWFSLNLHDGNIYEGDILSLIKSES